MAFPQARRSSRAHRREWSKTVGPAVLAQLTLMATNVKNNLTIAAGPVGANVLSVIAGAHAANGAYNSGTGVHAEVDAITNVGQANWGIR